MLFKFIELTLIDHSPGAVTEIKRKEEKNMQKDSRSRFCSGWYFSGTARASPLFER